MQKYLGCSQKSVSTQDVIIYVIKSKTVECENVQESVKENVQ